MAYDDFSRGNTFSGTLNTLSAALGFASAGLRGVQFRREFEFYSNAVGGVVAPTRDFARYGGAQQRQVLLNQVRASGTVSEAKGVVHSFREMKRLGYELQDVSLHYRGNQGLDVIFHNGSRYAVVEAKHGKYLSLRKTYKGNLRQGSLQYNTSYLQYGDGTHNTLAQQCS